MTVAHAIALLWRCDSQCIDLFGIRTEPMLEVN